jgi:hypothetical protein
MPTTDPSTVQGFRFRPRPGVTREQILDAADAMLHDVAQFAGFQGSRFYEDDAGDWIELIEWSSRAEAEAVLVIASWPSGRAFDSLLEPDSISTWYLESRRTYPPRPTSD